jgi:hypothetical protein
MSDRHLPPGCPDDEAFVARFEELLSKSSLGSPRALALQALTPPEVVAAVDAGVAGLLALRRTPETG